MKTIDTSCAPGTFTTRPSPWRLAFLLALTALGCGMLLGGLSVWFLGSVAIAGLSVAALTFNFHIPAALVRLFAVGRTAAKYGERIVGHRAALIDQCRRRADLFTAMAMAPGLRQAGWQLGKPERLSDYLDDVEDIDYARLRVDLPLLTVALATLFATGATALIAPLALLALAFVLAVLVAGAVRFRHKAEMLWQVAYDARHAAAAALGTSTAAVVALRAEGAFDAETHIAFAAFAHAETALAGIRREQASFDMLCGLAGPLTGAGVFASAWAMGAQLLVPTFLAFAWLSLGDALQGGGRIVFAAVRRRHALQRIAPEIGGPDGERAVTPEIGPFLSIDRLQRHRPDGHLIGTPLSLHIDRGVPVVLTGASGCGKTSLLKQIGGWLGSDVIASGTARLIAVDRRSLSFLCLHDAAVLSDTLRENLFAPAASDEALWAALCAVELDGRFAASGLDGWITQDTLSLGEAQRLNLARAWLSSKPIILLDEPTEHLDEDQAARILHRLLRRLKSRIVILSSHRSIAWPHTNNVCLDVSGHDAGHESCML